MKAYTVVQLPDNALSMGIHNTSAQVFDDIQSARVWAIDMARQHRGVKFALVEGSIVEAYRAEPVRVDAVAVDG